MSSGWVLPTVLSLVGTASAVALFPALSSALQKHRPEGKGAQLVSLGLEQIDPIFNQNRMHLTKQREYEAIMPARKEDGAPPRTKIDLEQGRATVRLPAKDTDQGTT
ncbi:DUF6191 domain-containing protein [Tenggerimyces flavus]|uniref:DUF6191 domain-containing protein n=1 Tax=Tenggerimyces flavus TaxID=1708749 RepID=A0ABV7YGY9_9ACTN|nr:DUF6191 domain-containing protein [Tenggerimyces flavus]MBM7783942.1 hypothetical protein [Tenggerimyces flavus]